MTTEAKHTPERPWWADLDGVRVVACLNACAGIPTEQLERGCVAELIEAAQCVEAFARAAPYNPIAHCFEHNEAGQKLRAALAPFQKDSKS